LNTRIKQHYSIHTFHAMARLDVPTFEDNAVKRQLEQAVSPNSRTTVAWDTVNLALNLGSAAIGLISQLSVLLDVLRGQPDGLLLTSLSFAGTLWQYKTPHYMMSGICQRRVLFSFIHIYFRGVGRHYNRQRLPEIRGPEEDSGRLSSS
jgi:hypothetical protein